MSGFGFSRLSAVLDANRANLTINCNATVGFGPESLTRQWHVDFVGVLWASLPSVDFVSRLQQT